MRSLAGSALVLLVSLSSAVGLTEQASATEPDGIDAAEGSSQTPSQPVSTDNICSALATAAAQNDLPTDFFARLIWQESRFDPAAVSRAGRRAWRSSCLLKAPHVYRRKDSRSDYRCAGRFCAGTIR
jgi:hypothetical protein